MFCLIKGGGKTARPNRKRYSESGLTFFSLQLQLLRDFDGEKKPSWMDVKKNVTSYFKLKASNLYTLNIVKRIKSYRSVET